MDKINPFIESISVNLFGGLFNTEVKFNNGLNVIGGENGQKNKIKLFRK